MDTFLNIGRAAEFLGVSQASLRAWSNDGRLPVYRTPGGQRRFRVEDLEAFVSSMRQTGRPRAAA
jgi:excisionase family DNA binding protein